MGRQVTIGAGIFVAISVLAGVFAFSTVFVEPVDRDNDTLIASFGLGMAVLSVLVALVPLRRGERWAWYAMLVWPLFFASHVAFLGTWVPDAPLFVLSLAALALTWPRR